MNNTLSPKQPGVSEGAKKRVARNEKRRKEEGGQRNRTSKGKEAEEDAEKQRKGQRALYFVGAESDNSAKAC